jgi:hypothetical protein
MNIKTMIIRTAKRVEFLVQSICGVSASSAPPARAPSAGQRLVSVGRKKVTSITTDAENEKMPSAKRRRKPTSSSVEVLPLEQRRWLTVKETSARFPCFSEQALRHLIYSAEAYANYPKAGLRSNGFIACIARPAGQRKVIINAAKFEEWLTAGANARNDLNLDKIREKSGRK